MVTGTAQFLGVDVQLWVGTPLPMQPGPILIYWHATASSGSEAEAMLGSAAIDDILSQGGVIAAPLGSTGTGVNTSGTSVFTSDDYAIADEIVACAAEQLNIDPRRIYTTGCSSGGLQAGAMLVLRSSYVAAGVTNSGGLWDSAASPQDEHAPAAMTIHGDPDTDVVILRFADTSARLVDNTVRRGGYAVNCDHGGGHCGLTPELRTAAWQFLMDHPFGVTPEPYEAGLPGTFPDDCAVQ
jgi:poly(3-hydroxybutyrate) depolymerase